MVDAIIFDFYGVLAINGWQAFKQKHFTDKPEKWNELYELGRQVDAGLAAYETLVIRTAEASGTSRDEVRFQLEHTVANDELLAYIAASVKPKRKIGLLSNASSNEALRAVLGEKRMQLFDAIVLSRDVGLTKPDVRMYQTMSEQLAVEPTRCLFVDDQERHCTGAREAGMHALLYADFDSFKREVTDYLANSKD